MGPEKIMRDNMNKLLLASTALVASTTFAMADVNISGFAEMGIFGGEDTDGSDLDTQFHSDIDVFIDMSGETDSGVTFGASIDLDSIDGDGDDFDDGAFAPDEAGEDASIFVSGALGTLTMGDTDGALDFALSEAIIGGSLQDDNEHLGYNGNAGLDGTYDGQVARYDYSFGDFTIALSGEIDDDPDVGLLDFENVDFDVDEIDAFLRTTARDIDNDTVLGVGVRYAGEFSGMSFGAGLGYQRAGASVVESVERDDDGDITDVEFDDVTSSVLGASLDVSMENGLQGIINYSRYDDVPAGYDNHLGLAVGYEFGALLVAANYGTYELEEGGDDRGYSVIANYDLGGGAELQGSYAINDPEEGEKYDRFSFGIAMSF